MSVQSQQLQEASTHSHTVIQSYSHVDLELESKRGRIGIDLESEIEQNRVELELGIE